MRRARRRPALRGRRKISRRSSNKTFKKGNEERGSISPFVS